MREEEGQVCVCTLLVMWLEKFNKNVHSTTWKSIRITLSSYTVPCVFGLNEPCTAHTTVLNKIVAAFFSQTSQKPHRIAACTYLRTYNTSHLMSVKMRMRLSSSIVEILTDGGTQNIRSTKQQNIHSILYNKMQSNTIQQHKKYWIILAVYENVWDDSMWLFILCI